jgi:3-phenylpropionate/trans-cinnamate dioxygenase ferredoxin reductase component
MVDQVLIVGAGQAGMQVAVSLRELDYKGEITIVGEEPYSPYQRPPLSKAFLAGDADVESLQFRSTDFYASNDITVLTGEKIIDVDISDGKGVARASSGRTLHFDRLVVTPGSTPRRLTTPGSELDGVLYLRNIADAEALKSRWAEATNVVVVGGGFIGLEVAAQATKSGKQATVLEAADRLIARAVSPLTSEYFRAAHERRGTSVRLSTSIEAFEGSNGRVTGVRLVDGEVIPADIILVGIGVVARGELAEKLGLDTSNGAIVVNEYAETSNPKVLAAGDAVLLPHPLGLGNLVRLESVQNAVDQAKVVASTIVGSREPYHAVPWFWSDQADIKLQIAGLSTGFDQTVLRGNPDDDKFSVLYYREGTLLAIDAVNEPSDYMAVRRALAAGASIDPLAAADPSVALKNLIISSDA